MNNQGQISEIFIEEIIPNRFQPRLFFDETKISELAKSIKTHGIIQPLVLRKIGDKYEIIAGERRFKAASMIGLTKVPAIIVTMDDNQSAEVALVENLQRKDLTAIEEAKSFKKLLDRGYLSQDQLAEKMGISQSSIANKLRLLNLSDTVQQALLEERISERHARSLLSVSDFTIQEKLLDKIQQERLTVRQLDEEINLLKNGSNVEKMDTLTDFKDIPSETIQQGSPSQYLFEIEKFDKDNEENSMANLEDVLTSSGNSFFQNGNFNDDSVKPVVETVDIPSFDELSIPKNLATDIPQQENPVTIEQAIEELVPESENPKSLYETEVVEEPLQKVEIRVDKSNFRTVEEAFAKLKTEIINAGLRIDMDTYDFDQYYQLIIKVYK